MMAVRALVAPDLKTGSTLGSFGPISPYSDSPWPHSATVPRSQLPIPDRNNHSMLSTSTIAASPAASPADPTAPSPISSDTGTEFTDIDEIEGSTVTDPPPPTSLALIQSKISPIKASPLQIETNIIRFPTRQTKSDDDEPPASVIYAPAGFGAFHAPLESTNSKTTSNAVRSNQMPELARSDSKESSTSDFSVSQRSGSEGTERFYDSQVPPTPLQTSLPTTQDWTSTPRAQTRQELGAFSRPGSSLASITEGDDNLSDHDISEDDLDLPSPGRAFFEREQDEVKALNNALTECWTLCNTLAGLSYVHRERIFGFSSAGNTQQQAWKSCWTLCQNLYNTRSDEGKSDVRPTLELCREFCQALFDVRVRDNETADSVLRVSFELNNHLFNTHDRNLPEAFRERTLDFYVTLCHRLMKQKSKMADETDSLLKSCWALAEMLFSLRQVKNDGRKADDELLSSAVQACWDLCDLFRDGWVQIRPERQTPRPSQVIFTQAFQEARQSGIPIIDHNGNKINPETPTTIFDDSTTDSPYEAPAPNIVVLGTVADSDVIPASASTTTTTLTSSNLNESGVRQTAYRWPSAALSITTNGGSIKVDPNSTSRSSSVHTARPSNADDHALILLKSLFVRAAVQTNRGFDPSASLSSTSSSRPSVRTSLPQFVKTLPETAFGAQTWQIHLLNQYQRAVLNDATFKNLGVAASSKLVNGTQSDPSTILKVRYDVAQAVKLMVSGTSGWMWLKDLFRYCFGLYVNEVLGDNPAKRGNLKTSQSNDKRTQAERRISTTSRNASRQSREGSVDSEASSMSHSKNNVT